MDNFYPDPIETFKKFDKQEMWRCYCVQQWVYKLYKIQHIRISRILSAREHNHKIIHEAGTIYESRKDLFDAYLIGEISDEVYREQIELMEKPHKSEWRLLDRLRWLEIMMKEQKALNEQLLQIYKATSPNKGKKPHVYGYDPRKNASKYNYTREDWGKTRENVYQHRKRKGK